MGIETVLDLRHHALALCKKYHDDDQELDNYLLSLLQVISQEQSTLKPSYSDIGGYLAVAFTSSPAPYNPEWLNIQVLQSKANTDPYYHEITTYGYIERTLKFQIADFKAMRSDGRLIGDHEWYGNVSPTGRKWYNYQVVSFIERGTEFLEGYSASDQEFTKSDGWLTLAFILEDGQAKE